MELTKELLEKLYAQQGLSLKQIGDLHGKTKQYVMYHMKKNSIPRRNLDL